MTVWLSRLFLRRNSIFEFQKCNQTKRSASGVRKREEREVNARWHSLLVSSSFANLETNKETMLKVTSSVRVDWIILERNEISYGWLIHFSPGPIILGRTSNSRSIDRLEIERQLRGSMTKRSHSLVERVCSTAETSNPYRRLRFENHRLLGSEKERHDSMTEPTIFETEL